MLQFNSTVFTIATRCTSRLLWRLNATLTTNAATKTTEQQQQVDNNLKPSLQGKEIDTVSKFNELKTKLCSDLNVDPSISSKIQNARNVHDLLELMKTPLLSQNNIVKAMGTISFWVNKNNVKEDGRNVLKSQEKSDNVLESKCSSELKVENVEEDMSRYCDLSTSEMIKEVNKLALLRDRNIPLLNYLFQNIMEYNKVLNAGACSSLMYSMSILNYSDERLLKKICTDLISIKGTNGGDETLGDIPHVTVVSIMKSMAYVRYRNNHFLDVICKDIVNAKSRYKTKQIASVLLSLATLGYDSKHTGDIIQKYKPQLTLETLGHSNWLNLVWCYVVFNRAQSLQVESVLNDKFISKVMFHDPKRKLSYQLKLLNINGYAQHVLKNYSGPFLNTDTVPYVVSTRSKQKEKYVSALESTLKNMMPSTAHFRMNVNSKMGFLLDAELYVDSNFKPMVANEVDNTRKFTKIAMLMVDYYDTCLGNTDHQGLIKLYTHLLRGKKYEVLCISYQNFGVEDKIERRITYLRRQLWDKFKKSF
ncbi:FAST kinase domain-containing protein 4 [Ceratina calcarata]|uniref:FAST kinase domain-containing protein 4 n=1 Tax=Ceratina calcarata TaxID=156304 RepID=A0AAJ7JEV0_9HYME|nr:FAST kinase domain-containing protein 4 [Ceratina calcarata]XP_017891494.1 FAST kinase domain-containing protein 4 [Ceratina calcarata]